MKPRDDALGDGQSIDRAVLERIEAKLDRLLNGQAAPAPRFLGIAAAAAYCGLSADSVRCLLARGDLTALYPVRGRLVVDREQLDKLILGSTRRPRGGRGAAAVQANRRKRNQGRLAAEQQSAGPQGRDGREADSEAS